MCGDGKCIDVWSMCDGIDDCDGKEDEDSMVCAGTPCASGYSKLLALTL